MRHRTTKDQTFCRNEYNVTGFCNRQSCPLANSRYATIRSDPADPHTLYLYVKTIERAHLPSKMWERQKLSNNYAKAIEQLDTQLAYWPKFLVHKCKQRLTRLTQVALRMRRLAKEDIRIGEKIVPRMAPKIRKREEGRERKAERAARVERAIERELIERLRSGAYGEQPLNVEEGMWKKVLKGLERTGEGVRDKNLDEGIEEEDEDEMERELEFETEGNGVGNVEHVSDIEGESDEERLEDLQDWDSDAGLDDIVREHGDSVASGEDGANVPDPDDEEDEKLKKTLAGLKRKRPLQPTARPAKKKIAEKGPSREIEYEIENEPPIRDLSYA